MKIFLMYLVVFCFWLTKQTSLARDNQFQISETTLPNQPIKKIDEIRNQVRQDIAKNTQEQQTIENKEVLSFKDTDNKAEDTSLKNENHKQDIEKYKSSNLILKNYDTQIIDSIFESYIKNGFYQKINIKEPQKNSNIQINSNFKIKLDYVIRFGGKKNVISVNKVRYKALNKFINNIMILSVEKKSATIAYKPDEQYLAHIYDMNGINKDRIVFNKQKELLIFTLETGQCLDIDTFEIIDKCLTEKSKREIYIKKR